MKTEEKNNLIDSNLKNKEWLGEVVENDDELREFRCKIKVYGVYDNLEIEDIPWAYPANSLSFSSIDNGGFGSGSSPKIGTILKVKFNNGNIYAPEYFSIQNINPSLKEEIGDDYFNSHVFCYDEDEELKAYYTQEKGYFISLKDSIINVRPDNTVYIEHAGGQIIHIQENKISLGSEDESDQPALLGDNTEKTLEEINEAIEEHISTISDTFGDLAQAAAPNPHTAALVPLFVKGMTELMNLIVKYNKVPMGSIPQLIDTIKSNIVTLD